MCVLQAKLDGPCWFGTPRAAAGSPLVLMSYCSWAFYGEVLPIPASSCRPLSHCCQSVANEWLEFAQRASNSTGGGPLTFPALDIAASQKQEKQLQVAVLFQALCEHWDAELWKEGLWTRKALVEKEKRREDHEQSGNTPQAWIAVPGGYNYLSHCFIYIPPIPSWVLTTSWWPPKCPKSCHFASFFQE